MRVSTECTRLYVLDITGLICTMISGIIVLRVKYVRKTNDNITLSELLYVPFLWMTYFHVFTLISLAYYQSLATISISTCLLWRIAFLSGLKLIRSRHRHLRKSLKCFSASIFLGMDFRFRSLPTEAQI